MVGWTAATSGEGSIAIGRNASAAGGVSGSIAIGLGASCTSAQHSVAIGRGAACSRNQGIVFGSDSYPLSNIFLGRGISSATASGVSPSIQGTSGSGTDIAGASIAIYGGQGTGTAAGGSILFGTSPASGASGASSNSYVTRMTIDSTGLVTINSGNISSPGGSGSEAFGSGAKATGSNDTCIGYQAGSSMAVGGTNNTLVGYQAGNSISGQDGNVCVGSSSNTTGHNNVVIGNGASSTGSQSIAIGNNALADSSNMMVVGSSGQPINVLFGGKGRSNATPTEFRISGTHGSGTDIAGGGLSLEAGGGTGTGAGGSLLFKTCPAAGSSGTSVNASVTRMTIDQKGNIVPGTGALATNATDGFLYIPTCAGAPSGTPTAFTGRVALVFDTTNNKLYVYDGGWIGVTLA